MATVNHTVGRCLCGHYHPKHEYNNPNIVEQEWANIWDWVSNPLNKVSWGTWIDLGPRES